MIPKFDLNFPLETQGKLSNYNVFTLVAPKGNDAYMSLSIYSIHCLLNNQSIQMILWLNV